MSSNAEMVREFTIKTGNECPEHPRVMTKDEVKFLVNMMVSEIAELAQTVCDNNEEVVQMIKDAAHIDLNEYKKPDSDYELIADQADAVVDCWYYGLNAFAKTGVNLSSVFDVVHDANMKKIFPDGTVHKRADGKIIKPDYWSPPNINAEIVNQVLCGSFSI